MSTSNKADRKRLPPPVGPRCQVSGPKLAPRSQTERLVASALAETLKLPDVSVQEHFFDDLGAHSLLMARFCSAIRQRIKSANVCMRDVYSHPTVEQLANKLDAEVSVSEPAAVEDETVHVTPSFTQYFICGSLQFLTYIALGAGLIAMMVAGVHWAHGAINDASALYQRVFVCVLAFGVAAVINPVVAKWYLVGRWKSEAVQIWSIDYFRFWFVKLLYDTCPAHLFTGAPVYNVWLRMLGARIGRHAVILSRAPVTTDLYSVGAGTIIRENTMTSGYRARNNVIETGQISIGADACIGTGSHLDIETVIEDGGQLAHSSTLQQGQRIPAGKHYHGTPAEETQTDFNTVEAKHCSTMRRWIYSGLLPLASLFLAPLPIMVLFYSHARLRSFSGADSLQLDNLFGVIAALAPMGMWLSFLIYTGLIMTMFVFIRVVSPLLNCFLQADRTYVLFGFHYYIQGLVRLTTNWSYMNLVLGDTSYIPKFLELVGWRIAPGRQTGSNFGLDQTHDNPYLCHVGSNSMVSDGIVMSNAEFGPTSFTLSDVRIGSDNFLGNAIVMPAGNKTGNNVLIGTKTLVPIDGPLRENCGLLGSPAFEIPRSTEADKQRPSDDNPDEVKARLSRKNRFNLATMAAIVAAHWFASFVTVFVVFLSIIYYERFGIAALLAGTAVLMAFVIGFFALLERASLGRGGLQARNVTMYDPYFLFHERHWKFCGHPLNSLFHGTPFRNLLSRALGVRLGKMVFDDGANLYDKTLLEIGDFSNLNKACILQAHSLEEGLFKSDTVRIGSHCTIAGDAFVHYGVEMGNGSTLGPNAFLMKGEQVPQGQTWQGNPASRAPVQSGALSIVAIQSARRPVASRKRPAKDARKVRSTVPWRRSPQPQPTITVAQSSGASIERQAIVGKIMAPVQTRKMFNGGGNG